MALFESPCVSVTPCGSARAGGDAKCTVVWLQGEHDAATTTFLVATLNRAAALDDADVLVDLGAVTFMDASTIGAIIGARNRLGMQARSLEIRAPSPVAAHLLELCGLMHLVRRVPLAAVHGTGVADALGSWVEVPSRPSTRPPANVSELQARFGNAANALAAEFAPEFPLAEVIEG
jgi:anti-anti-sigma factor